MREKTIDESTSKSQTTERRRKSATNEAPFSVAVPTTPTREHIHLLLRLKCFAGSIAASSHKESAGDEIPPEFIDPITCEIMTLPVILPSGVVVDRTTLDRHLAEQVFLATTKETLFYHFSLQERKGRRPNDPYTSQAFTASLRPRAHVTLKERLDLYWLHNSDKAARLKVARACTSAEYAPYTHKGAF